MKLISCFFIITILISLIPPGVVRADSLNVAGNINATWSCAGAIPGPCPADGNSPWGYSGETTHGYQQLLLGKLNCDGFGCSKIDVYIEFGFNLDWVSGYDRQVSYDFSWYGSDNSPAFSIIENCGIPGKTGHCAGHYYVKIPAEYISADPNSGYHVSTTWGVGGIGVGDTATTGFYIFYSATPINVDKCDKNYKIENCVATGSTIQANSEQGNSYTLTQGKKYRLKIHGGPWHSTSGGGDRYDLAFSFDNGAHWGSINDLLSDKTIECIQNDPENTDLSVIYFTAKSNSLRVRVNDTAGQFADNTGSMTIDLCAAVYVGAGAKCDGQFKVSSTVAAQGTVPANVPGWAIADITRNFNWIVMGKWYALTTREGPWQNNAAPPDRYDIQIADNQTGPYWMADSYPLSNCSQSGGNYITVYFQGGSNKQLFLRVHDEDLNFGDNTGSMGYIIYEVSDYKPFPSGCALSYDVANLIESREVVATNNGGITLMATSDFQWPVWPFGGGETIPKMSRYLVLETTLVWYNDNVSNVNGEMKQDTDSWYKIQDWPQAVCVQTIDPIGHVRVFFDATKDRTWKFRVNDPDGNIWNNSGTLGYNLYYAVNYTVPSTGPLPASGFCDSFYSHETSGVTITLEGNNGNGIPLPLIGPDQIVAIQVVDGPWKNNSVDSYLTGISDDDGMTYTEITAYSGTVCKEQAPDANHPLAYVYGRAGKNYRVRVYDTGLNFADNTLSIKMTIYNATPKDNVNTWKTCANNYDLSEVPLSDDQRRVGAANLDGVQVPKIESGKNYAIEITGEGGGWGPLNNFSADLKLNSEAWSWFPQFPHATCVVQLTQESNDALNRFRVYFTAGAGDTYRVRADTLVPNIGAVYFKLYSTSSHSSPLPPNPYNPPFPESPWGGCNAMCIRPGSLLTSGSFGLGSISFGTLGTVQFPSVTLPLPNVGAWVDFARCSTVVYLSWCDQHTAAVIALFASVNTKEPFGTIEEMSSGYKLLRTDIQDLGYAGGQSTLSPGTILFGPARGGDTWQGLLSSSPLDNPLISGKIDLTSTPQAPFGGGSSDPLASYSIKCNASVSPIIGKASITFCWFMTLMHTKVFYLSILTWMQLTFDLVMMLSLLAYIMKNWIGPGGVPA